MRSVLRLGYGLWCWAALAAVALVVLVIALPRHAAAPGCSSPWPACA